MEHTDAKRPKLCFVYPEYARATHFSYVAEFVEALSSEYDIFLIVEKGDLPETWGITRRYRQRMHFLPLRFLEIFCVLLGARMRGYRTHYVHYSFSGGIASALVTRMFGGRTLYWNCGMPWLFRRPPFQEWYERLTFRLVHNVVTGALSLVSDYARYYGIQKEKIVVVPNWIGVKDWKSLCAATDTTLLRKTLHIPFASHILLFVHRLAKRKGANQLPEILERLKDPSVVLLVAGDGPEEKTLGEAFAQKGLSSRVHMLGSLPRERVAEHFAIADIFLLPSEEEGFPHVILEAQTAGVPYVATDVGGVREISPPSEHPYIVPPGDMEQFVERLRALLNNDLERDRMKGELSEWALHYDKARVLGQFVDMLRRVA